MSVLIEPHIPTLFGQQLKEKRRSFLVGATVNATLKCNFLDSNGDIFSPSEDDYNFKARFVESVSLCEPQADVTNIQKINDSFHIEIPRTISETPAIYCLSLAAFTKENNKLEYLTDYFVYLEPTVWLDHGQRGKGPPPYDQLKIKLRDSSIFENELTQQIQFQLTDVCQAVECAVSLYNRVPPMLNVLAHTTATFNNHELLIEGIKAELFGMMIEHYRKNSLRYVAAGVQIDDSKLQEYMLGYQAAVKEFTDLSSTAKIQQNYQRGIGLTRGLLHGRFRI